MADDGITGTVQLKGAREVREAFADLRSYLPKYPVSKAVRDGANLLLGYIVLLAPKLTGRLARNIKMRTRRTKETTRARVTVNTQGSGKNPQNAFYWRFLEEGFHVGRGKGDFKKYPFVITAFNALKNRAAQQVVDSVDQAINRAERRAKKAL